MHCNLIKTHRCFRLLFIPFITEKADVPQGKSAGINWNSRHEISLIFNPDPVYPDDHQACNSEG